MVRTILTLALAAVAQTAVSDEQATAGDARGPGEMSVEERVQMMRSAHGYDACVYSAALEQVDGEDDIRRIADMAMGYCEPHLEDLRRMVEGWGFDPGFASGFARNVRDRAAHKVLPELAIRKSR